MRGRQHAGGQAACTTQQCTPDACLLELLRRELHVYCYRRGPGKGMVPGYLSFSCQRCCCSADHVHRPSLPPLHPETCAASVSYASCCYLVFADCGLCVGVSCFSSVVQCSDGILCSRHVSPAKPLGLSWLSEVSATCIEPAVMIVHVAKQHCVPLHRTILSVQQHSLVLQAANGWRRSCLPWLTAACNFLAHFTMFSVQGPCGCCAPGQEVC